MTTMTTNGKVTLPANPIARAMTNAQQAEKGFCLALKKHGLDRWDTKTPWPHDVIQAYGLKVLADERLAVAWRTL